jgi:flavin reductase (DIM6/NTAB) family NADH-FMN oxidoreductase RutF
VTDGEDLRGLMRFVPHNVAVLAVDHDGDSMGVTISSLVSLSLDPPLVGVSIGKQASLYELLRNAKAFAVSLLGDGQEALAQRFASGRPPIVHWDGVATRPGRFAPLVEDALGWIEARTIAEHDVVVDPLRLVRNAGLVVQEARPFGRAHAHHRALHLGVVAAAALDDVAPAHLVPHLLRLDEHAVHVEDDRVDAAHSE